MLKNIHIEVDAEEIEEIFRELEEAKLKIWKCYDRLNAIEVIHVKRVANTDSSK